LLLGKSNPYITSIRTNEICRWGNLNGIVSSNIYRTKDAPQFYPGHSVVLAYLTVFLFGGSIVTTLLLRAENKKRVQGKRDHWAEGKTPEQLEIAGDKRSVHFESLIVQLLTSLDLISSTSSKIIKKVYIMGSDHINNVALERS
jgi:hypothetical protein